MKTRGGLTVLYAIQGMGTTGREEIHMLVEHPDGSIEYIPLFTSGLYWTDKQTDYDLVEGEEYEINKQ